MFFRRFSTLITPMDPRAVLSRLPTDTLYNKSVALCAAAGLKIEPQYRDTLGSMEEAFKKTPNNSHTAWMKGRVAQAATDIGDYKTAETAVSDAKRILSKETTVDACHAWTLGYLASINSDEYKQHKVAMLNAASQLTAPSDALWAHVMNLQAAARENDPETFYGILDSMKAFTKTAHVSKALTHVPANDWQAWALGITNQACITIGNRKLHDDLTLPLQKAIQHAVATNSMGNALLAHISATRAAKIFQEKIIETSAPKPGLGR